MVSLVIESKSKLNLLKRALLSHLVLTTKTAKTNPPYDYNIEVAEIDQMIEIIDTKLAQIKQEQE